MNRISFCKFKAILVLLLTISVTNGFAQNEEMRAYWCSRFDWPRTGQTATENNIRFIFDRLVDNNFNAVLFQIRGQMDTLYPNPYEPWTSNYGWTDPGWDPVAFAIEEAHARGLEFHAYINTHTMAQPVPPANTSPQHIFNIHGPGSTEDWTIHDEAGNSEGFIDGYYWLSPGIPEASWWTRRSIIYVVENYDIDGLHFDRIRTPGPEFSHDPISEERFASEGNPDNQDFGDWTRSQITRDLRKIYGQVNQIKPHVVISSAPFGICKRVPGGYQGFGTQSFFSWHQDSFGWMESHVMDVLFPQIYWEIGSAHPFEVLFDDFMQFDGGRYIYPGINANNDEIAQILQTRTQGGLGTTIWPGSTVLWDEIGSGPYAQEATVPTLPWKTDPQTGIVVGNVTDAIGNPVVDAKINITDDAYNYLSAFDGFYSVLDVVPGTFQLVAEKEGLGIATGIVTIDKGEVKVVDLVFPNFTVDEIIDNDEPGFSINGNWQVSGFGNNYNGNKRYLNVTDSGPDVSAEWNFENIPAGQYRLTFWANDNAYVSEASYTILSDGEEIPQSPVIESQLFRGDGWHDLAIFNAGDGDVTIQLSGIWPSNETILVADAMRLVLLSANVDTLDYWFLY